MTAVDLVGLQKSVKTITNPFGFDFVWTWNGKAIRVPGDGAPRQVIGILRDHLAWHLYNKVRNQYHDEQVNKLREAGNEKGARKYRVPREVENKIYQMITGENLYDDGGELRVQNVQADLTELKKEISKLDSSPAGAASAVSVSDIIDEANKEALETVDQKSDTLHFGHSKGAARVNKEVEVQDKVSDFVDKAAEKKEPAPQQPANEPAPGAAGDDEFAQLSELA